MQHSNLKSARAWRLKRALRDVYAQAVQSNCAQTAEAALRGLTVVGQAQPFSLVHALGQDAE